MTHIDPMKKRQSTNHSDFYAHQQINWDCTMENKFIDYYLYIFSFLYSLFETSGKKIIK